MYHHIARLTERKKDGEIQQIPLQMIAERGRKDHVLITPDKQCFLHQISQLTV